MYINIYIYKYIYIYVMYNEVYNHITCRSINTYRICTRTQWFLHISMQSNEPWAGRGWQHRASHRILLWT